MSDDPEIVHAGMRRLQQGRLSFIESLESQGILCLNNANEYVGSGGFGFSDQLPSEGFSGTVRIRDMWGFCEAQTMSEVSPAMHEEFVLEYQLPILEKFGLNCYGCCEPLHLKLDMLLSRVPRLRRVSISPWADKRISAEKLQRKAIFSWKPNPAALAAVTSTPTGCTDIRETVDIASRARLRAGYDHQDTHTCNHEPRRFDEWCKIAKEEALRGAE